MEPVVAQAVSNRAEITSTRDGTERKLTAIAFAAHATAASVAPVAGPGGPAAPDAAESRAALCVREQRPGRGDGAAARQDEHGGNEEDEASHQVLRMRS